MAAVQRVLLTLWVGALWGVGYLAVPVLFQALPDRMLAGALAGRMFHWVSLLGLVAGGLLLLSTAWGAGRRWPRCWRLWVLAGMLALVLVGELALQPAMADLKAQGLAPGSAAAARFGRLHGLASVLYLLTALGGLALVAAGLPGRQAQAGLARRPVQ